MALVRPARSSDSFLATIGKEHPAGELDDEPVLEPEPSVLPFAESLHVDPEPALTEELERTEVGIEPRPGETFDPEPEPALVDDLEPEAIEPEPYLNERIDDEEEAPAEEAPPAPRWLRYRGVLVSLAIHGVFLIPLIEWPISAVHIPPPIPVQLILEEPQPEPKASEQQPAPPPVSGPLASTDMGDPSVDKPDAGASAATQAPTRTVAEPSSPKEPPPPPPKKPARDQVASISPPKPKPPAPAAPRPPKPAPVTAAPQAESRPSEAPRRAKYPGPSATRDEYLAYLLQLTKEHIDLLPLSIIGDRQGETVIAIVVLDNGTIARINVAQSSGYPDIDTRVEQMVAAVGRFPPLPQRYQTPAVELNLRLRFPDALEH